MKTDFQLRRDVMDELAWDAAIGDSAIGVGVRDGIVTLSGHLDSHAEKAAIEHALRRVSGVKAVALELDVRLAPEHVRSDTEIAAAAEHALRWNSVVPADAVRVTVEQGGLRLEGQVDWDFQRRAAGKAVRSLIGVRQVSNEISIRPRASPADLSRRIGQALERQALREAHHLELAVDDGTVTLRGRVRSMRERAAVQGAVRSAPGVRHVVDELTLE